MRECRVVTDSGADLPKSTAAELGVTLVPLIVNFGEETYLDGELDMDTFWDKARHVHPKTSQPPMGVFEEAFARLVDEGADVLCITLTGKHSGTYSTACMAAQRFGRRVTVFDSKSVSWGQRFQVEAAVAAAREGQPVSEIVKMLAEMQTRLHMFFLVDTLEYLERGGRIAKLLPTIKRFVRFFNIKPLLTMIEGEVRLMGVVNSFARGELRIEREVLALGPLERLGVFHMRNHERALRLAESLATKLSQPTIEIPIVEAGAVLSTHGGPGVVAAIALRQRPS